MAKYPLIVIPVSLTFMALTCLGIMNIYEETEQLELWVPTDSEFYDNTKWLQTTFPSDVRVQSIMLVTKNEENILTKENLLFLVNVSKAITELK